MTSYDAVIQSKLGDPSKFLVSKNVQIDIKDKYVDSFRTLNEVTVPPDCCDYDPDSLPFEPTSEEAAMEQLDEYIGAEINLATKNGPQLVKVVSRKRDGSGTLIGSKHTKATLDTRLYNVQYPDGHYEQYATNVLAEALYAGCDKYGVDTG